MFPIDMKELRSDVLAAAGEEIRSLTRERDEARSLVRRILVAYDRTGATPALISDLRSNVALWDAEDAQAAKKDGDS